MNNIIYLVPGFISYILLRPFGFFKFNNNLDRQLTLLILSIINSIVTTNLTNKSQNLIYIIAVSAMITLCYFGLFYLYRKLLPIVANKINFNLYDNDGTLEHILSENYKDKQVFLISFDFDNDFIASGYVFDVDDQGNQQVGLKSSDWKEYTIVEAQELCGDDNNNSLVIDYANKTKNFVIVS